MSEDKAVILVRAEALKKSRKLAGLSRRRKYVAIPEPEEHLYVSVQETDGSRSLLQVLAEGIKETNGIDRDSLLYRVRTAPVPVGLLFSKVKDNAWDLVVEGYLSFKDTGKFLRAVAMNLAGLHAPLTVGLTESWLVNQVGARVRDAAFEHTIGDLRNTDALPSVWWQEQFGSWLNDVGLNLTLSEVRWRNTDAEAAETAAVQQKEIERLIEARQREQMLELEMAREAAAYKEHKRGIEADLILSDKERAHQLQLLETKHRTELLEAERALENTRREAEKAALEHDVRMAQLRGDMAALCDAQKSVEKMDARHSEVMNELESLKKILTKLSSLPEHLLAGMSGEDREQAHSIAERLISPEFGISPSALAGLGFQVDRQSLIGMLREREGSIEKRVSVRKAELVTRDIGTARVHALPVNSSMRLEFTTERSGYVTLLNIGTSGAVYIHIPNAYVSPGEAKAVSGHTYTIPGEELLPIAQMHRWGLDYVEIGPPGWEHLAVIVSDVPLIDDPVCARAVKQDPFIRLSNREIGMLYEALDNAAPETWSGGVLSFLVE